MRHPRRMGERREDYGVGEEEEREEEEEGEGVLRAQTKKKILG